MYSKVLKVGRIRNLSLLLCCSITITIQIDLITQLLSILN